MEIALLQNQIREAERRIREIRQEESRKQVAEAQAIYDAKFEEWRNQHLTPTGFTIVPPPHQGVWAKPNPKASNYVIAELIIDSEYGWQTVPMTEIERMNCEEYMYGTDIRPKKKVLIGRAIRYPDSLPEPIRAALESLLPIRFEYIQGWMDTRDGIGAYRETTRTFIPSVYGKPESNKAFVDYWVDFPEPSP